MRTCLVILYTNLRRPCMDSSNHQAWFNIFTRVMLAMIFKQSQENHTLFIKHSSFAKVTVLLVYVDDIIVIRDNNAKRQQLNEFLTKEFDINIPGKLEVLSWY